MAEAIRLVHSWGWIGIRREAKAVGNEGKIYRLLPLTNTTIIEIKSFRSRNTSEDRSGK
jgi:hypothetical protein